MRNTRSDQRRLRRRWVLTPDEAAKVAEAREQPLTPLTIARLAVGSPRLLAEVASDVLNSARRGVARSSPLTWLLDSERVRRAVPDAARSVGFFDEAPFLDVLIPLLGASDSVADIGAGDGRIARHVAPRVSSVTCADPSATMVREAQENLSGFGNVEAVRTRGFKLAPLISSSFDLIYTQGVISYLDLNETLSLFDEMRRVARDDGLLVANAFTIDTKWRSAQQVRFVRAAGDRFSGGFFRPYVSSQVVALLAAVGFTTVETIQPQHDERWEPTIFVACAKRSG